MSRIPFSIDYNPFTGVNIGTYTTYNTILPYIVGITIADLYYNFYTSHFNSQFNMEIIKEKLKSIYL
jgi:hypothetical protein